MDRKPGGARVGRRTGIQWRKHGAIRIACHIDESGDVVLGQQSLRMPALVSWSICDRDIRVAGCFPNACMMVDTDSTVLPQGIARIAACRRILRLQAPASVKRRSVQALLQRPYSSTVPCDATSPQCRRDAFSAITFFLTRLNSVRIFPCPRPSRSSIPNGAGAKRPNNLIRQRKADVRRRARLVRLIPMIPPSIRLEQTKP